MQKFTIKLFWLTILLAVEILAADYSGFIGDDIDFVCNDTNVRWLLPNNTELKVSTEKFVLDRTEHESKFRINNFQPHDSGIYKCRRQGENINFNHFDLKEFYALEFLDVQKSAPIVVNEGAEVSFECNTKGVPSPVDYWWWFGDNKLWHGGNIKIVADKITLKNITKHQSGQYACIVEQKFKTYRNIQQKNFDLVVVGTNSTYNPPEQKEILEGKSLSLDCNLDYIDNENSTWYKNGKRLERDNNVNVSSAELKIKNIQPKHAGLYSCEHSEEESGSNYQVVVKHAPVFQNPGPIKIKAKIGETVTLNCAAKAFPHPTFNWLQTSEIFENVETFNDLSRLKVTVNNKEQLTNFTCSARNKYGIKALDFILTSY